MRTVSNHAPAAALQLDRDRRDVARHTVATGVQDKQRVGIEDEGVLDALGQVEARADLQILASEPWLTISMTASGNRVMASSCSSGSRQKMAMSGRFREPSGKLT